MHDHLPLRRLLSTGFLLWAFSAGACSIPQVTFQRDAAVHDAFESAVILPGYDYYYSGPEDQPLAIVGIRRGLSFEPGFWKPIVLTEKQLQDWVWIIQAHTRHTRNRYHGAKILDPDGREIGIWFSFLDWVVAEVTPEGRVIVHTPDQNDANLQRLFGTGGRF